jgi:NADPH-dependent curcumin reductase CurA
MLTSCKVALNTRNKIKAAISSERLSKQAISEPNRGNTRIKRVYFGQEGELRGEREASSIKNARMAKLGREAREGTAIQRAMEIIQTR